MERKWSDLPDARDWEIQRLQKDAERMQKENEQLTTLVKTGREVVSGCLIAMASPECEAWLNEVEAALTQEDKP